MTKVVRIAPIDDSKIIEAIAIKIAYCSRIEDLAVLGSGNRFKNNAPSTKLPGVNEILSLRGLRNGGEEAAKK
jgi:hypothetical protein